MKLFTTAALALSILGLASSAQAGGYGSNYGYNSYDYSSNYYTYSYRPRRHYNTYSYSYQPSYDNSYSNSYGSYGY